MLGKIKITDDLVKDIEHELSIIVDKFRYSIKCKKDLINELDSKNKYLDYLIKETMNSKNDKVIDVLNVINKDYKNIVKFNITYTDNISTSNGNYIFTNGERTLLNDNEISINEISRNYKIELNINRAYLSYMVFNDSLKTIDTFRVYFIDGNTQVYFVKEFSPKDKIIEINKNCTKIIVEGIGAREICTDTKICVGKNKTNTNRGVVVLECDFSKVKVSNYYHISCHDDIKVFICKKSNMDFLLPYSEFKNKYYLLENLVDTNVKTDVNLIDNYLVAFIDTNNSLLNEIKIYGVD